MCSNERKDLASNGSVLATALYGPYGVGRYSTGAMPTSKGYTGQRQDSGSGLDDYGARYYDAAVGQFTSADSVQGPNRYAYVGGNPETATDPTGTIKVGDPSGDYPGPQTGRTNYYKQYMQYYWDDENAGTGQFINQAGADQTDEDEKRDGDAIAAWFGLTVIRPKRLEIEGYKEPDYYVGVYGKLHHLPGGLLLPGEDVSFGDVANALFGSDKMNFPTAVELYTPTSPNWDNPRSSNRGGIVKKAFDKGKDQASILAIDLDQIEQDGQMSDDQLRQYASTVMYWPGDHGPSQVMRVLFIRNGKVFMDVPADPTNVFGPPASGSAPPHPPLEA